jgi:NitT/TauT family transport system permease protein
LRDAVNVPVFASSLLLAPFIAATLAKKQRVGVITAEAVSLSERHLEAAGIDPATVYIIGMDGCSEFAATAWQDRTTLDFTAAENEAVGIARRLLVEAPDIGAVLLECSLLPPYASAIQAEIGLPIFDFTQLISLVHQACARTPFVGSLAYPVGALIALIAIWYGAVKIFRVPSYLLPLPNDVIARIVEDWWFLLHHSWITTYITLGGFLLSVVIAVPLAIALVASRILERAVMPWLILSQTFPKVALAPLIVVWFGLGLGPKLVITFLVAFFPILVSTIVGLRSIEHEMIELASSIRASTLQTFFHFRLPMALPNIFAGMKVSIAFSVVGAVIGEWVGANAGLGYLLLQANANLDTSLLFAVLVMLLIIGVVLYYAVEFVERLIIPWHSTIRLQNMAA